MIFIAFPYPFPIGVNNVAPAAVGATFLGLHAQLFSVVASLFLTEFANFIDVRRCSLNATEFHLVY